MERMQELKSSLAKKRALAVQLLMGDDNNAKGQVSLENLYERFNTTILEDYKRAYAEFDSITGRDNYFTNPSSLSNIDQILKMKQNHHVIDGADFSKNLCGELRENGSLDDQNNALREKIFKFIYENMDRNETIRNVSQTECFVNL